MNDRQLIVVVVFGVLCLVAFVYWPSTHGVFIWDDTSSIHDAGWLRGDIWKEAVFRGFNGWINYFRPLIVLLFVFETRAFDVMPGPMHAVSVAIHLSDTLLVGLLAWRIAIRRNVAWHPVLLIVLPMMFYGLHPALIEPVDWVGCQFELAVVFFILLALLANVSIESVPRRALAVGLCFLLAAGFKEAAAALPPLLVLFDLALAGETNWPALWRVTWRRQHFVYAAVLAAGIAYLAVRIWGLGYAVMPSGTESLLSFTRLQRVSLTYLSYWKLIIWPMTSIGLIHGVDEKQFAVVTLRSLGTDVAAALLALGGLYAFGKRWLIGFAILGTSVALLPVLNIIPIGFNEGLYHDRYATTAIAIASALLPSLFAPLIARSHAVRVTAPLVALVWFGFAIADIRVTVPLWNDELALWQWAARQEPDAVTPKEHLLSTYIGRNDHARGRELADWLVANHPECVNCMLNAANLAVADHDPARAALALGKVKDRNLLAYNKGMLEGYVFANGELSELQGDLSGAEEAYRDAITLDPASPVARFSLALLLVKTGRAGEGKATADAALSLFAPDERELRRVQLAQALAPAGASR